MYDGCASGDSLYNYFRDYDPSIGRYIESDPIGLQGGINTYGYAESNALALEDPLGLQAALGAAGSSGGLFGQCCSALGGSKGPTGIRELDNELRPHPRWPSWLMSESKTPEDIIGGAVVPPFPGLKDLKDCSPGRRLAEPATNKRWKGGLSIQQEYFCPCGQITRHTIIKNDVVVHDHFRPGPPKPGGDD